MIELKEITYENAGSVLKLKVAKDQEDFVASNDYSLAQAYCSLKEDKYPNTALAIANGEEIVGFLMYEYCPYLSERDDRDEDDDNEEEYFQEEPYYHLFRYMIGEQYQDKGYGRVAMEKLIEHMKKRPQGPADAIYICYCPPNVVAKKFYEAFGFEDTGQVVDGEYITRLGI